MKSTVNFNLNSNLTKLLSINIRYASNFESIYRFGGGIEFHPWQLGIIRPSIGFEIFHNREFFYELGIDDPFKFRSTHIPIMIDVIIFSKFRFDLGVVVTSSIISGTDGSLLRSTIYY